MQGLWVIIKSLANFVKGVGTFFLGILTIFILGILMLGSESQTGVSVPKGAVLVLNPVGNIVEQKQLPTTLDIAFSDLSEKPTETSIHDILHAIRTAKEDSRISAIAILTDQMGGAGVSHIHDMVDAVKDFKSSGKPVYAISTAYSQKSYLLVSQADKIFMNPTGSALLQGYNIDVTYYKGLLDKLGVTMNIFHVGDYKSAIEPYERTSMSPAAREAYQHLLGGLWADYMQTVAEGRQVNADDLQKKIDSLPDVLKSSNGDFAALAKAMGLVDSLLVRTDWRDFIGEKHGYDGDSFSQINLKNYLAAIGSPWVYKNNQVAVIVAQGEIVDGYGPVTVTASETLASKIRSARTDETVKAIVLRVNSPGGSAFGSEIIRQELAAAQADGLPVVVSMGPVAASGGYWISATADEIWAAPTTITGSIGIFGIIPTFEKASAMIGVSGDSVGTSKVAGGISLDRPLTEPVKSIISQSINRGYYDFIDLVAKGRNMDREAVEKIAQGRVWTGRQALDNGLVDKLGTLSDAIKSAAEKAGLKRYSAYMISDRMDPFDQFLMDLMNGQMQSNTKTEPSASDRLLRGMKKELDFLSRLNDPQGRYVICVDCQVN